MSKFVLASQAAEALHLLLLFLRENRIPTTIVSAFHRCTTRFTQSYRAFKEFTCPYVSSLVYLYMCGWSETWQVIENFPYFYKCAIFWKYPDKSFINNGLSNFSEKWDDMVAKQSNISLRKRAYTRCKWRYVYYVKSHLASSTYAFLKMFYTMKPLAFNGLIAFTAHKLTCRMSTHLQNVLLRSSLLFWSIFKASLSSIQNNLVFMCYISRKRESLY